MGRPRNALNVTDADRERIRELYVAGVRMVEIAKRVGRGESVVYRAVKGLERPRPRPKPRTTTRDRQIAQLVLKRDVPQVKVAEQFGLTPTRVCQIVREARGLRPKKARPVEKPPKVLRTDTGPVTARPVLTRAQRARRDLRIRRLVLEEGVGQAAVARRFGITRARVQQIVKAGSGR